MSSNISGDKKIPHVSPIPAKNIPVISAGNLSKFKKPLFCDFELSMIRIILYEIIKPINAKIRDMTKVNIILIKTNIMIYYELLLFYLN